MTNGQPLPEERRQNYNKAWADVYVCGCLLRDLNGNISKFAHKKNFQFAGA